MMAVGVVALLYSSDTWNHSRSVNNGFYVSLETNRSRSSPSDGKQSLDVVVQEPIAIRVEDKQRTDSYQRTVISTRVSKLHDTTPPSSHLTREEFGLSRTRGFLLAKSYDQQLQAALHGYYQLAKLTGLLNLSAVEPFVLGTSLVGVPVVGSEVLKLGDLYDLDGVKGRLTSNSILEELVSYNTFTERASSHVVLVLFLTNLKSFEVYFSGENKNSRIIEISTSTAKVYFRQIMKAVNQWILAQTNSRSTHFLISRLVLIDVRPYHPLPLSHIIDKLNSVIHEQVEKFGSATIIIERWRGIHNVSDSKFFYFIPGFVDAFKPRRRLLFSSAVVTAAQRFAQTMTSAHPVVGVHIRGERLLLDSKGKISVYVQCLEELQHFLSSRPVPVANEQVRVFHDLGPYGTMSCTLQYCTKGRARFVEDVAKLGFPIVSFDPAVFESVPTSPAFVSLVEMEYLSHVDLLVTVGRGGFQQSMVERFLSSSQDSTDRVHRICNTRPERPWKPITLP